MIDTTLPKTALQLQSTIRSDGRLDVRLVEMAMPVPQDGEVLVRIEATPINPSDLGLLLGPANLSTAKVTGSGDEAVVTAQIPPQLMRALAGRVDQSLPVGNEGGGVVVEAGSSPAAQALIGKTVGILGGAMYAQYRAVKAADALVVHADATPKDAASCFVNPLTALAMVETMRMEGHTALVHTAAASNLGQMLNRLCLEDKIPLVNIVRSPAQADLLRIAGADYVCDSSSDTFMADLIAALKATSATIAFDAIGGGTMASSILTGMEVAASAGAEFSRYGSSVHKQVYIYGGLDRGPTELARSFGMAWGIGGFLVTPFLAKVGPEKTAELRGRVAAGLTTTFASRYTDQVTLAGALSPEAIAVYGRQATGQKYLVIPNG